MGLLGALGLRDHELFGGRSLPQYLNDMQVGQKPRVSEADRSLAEAVREQRAINEADRVAMLAKIRERLEQSDNELDAERRHRIVDRLSEAELQLERKAT